jgi:hypothetical protein
MYIRSTPPDPLPPPRYTLYEYKLLYLQYSHKEGGKGG